MIYSRSIYMIPYSVDIIRRRQFSILYLQGRPEIPPAENCPDLEMSGEVSLCKAENIILDVIHSLQKSC